MEKVASAVQPAAGPAIFSSFNTAKTRLPPQEVEAGMRTTKASEGKFPDMN